MTQLLCTFAQPDTLDATVSDIADHYEVSPPRVFALQNADDPSELFCTYNIDADAEGNRPMRSTISVHRKQHTNTIYTINALNALIRELNGGALDTGYSIPWGEYSDRIMLSDETGVNHVHTNLYNIIDV